MILKSYYFVLTDFLKNVKKGLLSKRAGTFFALQISISIIFGFLYYFALWYETNILKHELTKDNMQLDLFETMHFSLITQTTVGYSGGFSGLTKTGKVINFIQLILLLAVFLVL